MVCRRAIPSGNAVKSEHSDEWQEPFLVYMYDLLICFLLTVRKPGAFFVKYHFINILPCKNCTLPSNLSDMIFSNQIEYIVFFLVLLKLVPPTQA